MWERHNDARPKQGEVCGNSTSRGDGTSWSMPNLKFEIRNGHEIYLSLSYTILVVCCDAYIKVCGQVDLHFECFGQVESSIEWCLIRMHLKDTYIHCYSADGSFILTGGQSNTFASTNCRSNAWRWWTKKELCWCVHFVNCILFSGMRMSSSASIAIRRMDHLSYRRPVQHVRIYELPQQRMEMTDQERVVLMCVLC